MHLIRAVGRTANHAEDDEASRLTGNPNRPNPKSQGNSKYQISNFQTTRLFEIWELNVSLELGAWDLEL